MCQECGFITGHANTCPNNPDIYEPILTDCVLCGREVDEIETTYGICEKCWTEAHNFENAMRYGASNQLSVKINGLYAKALTPEQIDSALHESMIAVKLFAPDRCDKLVQSFLSDDDGDFSDWLKGEKK